MKADNQHRILLIAGDLLASAGAILLFNLFRYHWIYGNSALTFAQWSHDTHVAAGYIVFPVTAVLIFAIMGFYNNPDFKSRYEILSNTVVGAFISSLLIYFVIMVNDKFDDRLLHYSFLLMLFASFTATVLAERYIIDSMLRHRRRRRLETFNVIVVGSDPSVAQYAAHLEHNNARMGYKVVGLVGDPAPDVTGYDWPVYTFEDLPEIIKQQNVKVCVIARPSADKDRLTADLNRLFALDVGILMPLEGYNLATLRPRLSNIVGEPLVDITATRMSEATSNIKRLSDIAVSIVALTLLLPFFGIIAAAIKIDSRGPVFYRQQRLGLHRRKFWIYKFRSMIVDSEPDGPQLSSVGDLRITRLGRILRKYRIDELPQFWNVLRGDMSIVGPRPEREHYFAQLSKTEPAINMITNVRPGITSLGSVKFGYAGNLEQMRERMYFELVYLESMSPGMDFKILFHTISTVITGKGI